MSETGLPGGVSELLLEEYKTCRQQILDDIKSEDQLEVYSVGAVAAVFVFVLSQKDPTIIRLALGLSSLIAVFALVRCAALDKTIGILNDYIQSIESRHPQIGWTRYYRTNRTRYLKWSRYSVAWSLLIVTILFQVVLYTFGPFWIAK